MFARKSSNIEFFLNFHHSEIMGQTFCGDMVSKRPPRNQKNRASVLNIRFNSGPLHFESGKQIQKLQYLETRFRSICIYIPDPKCSGPLLRRLQLNSFLTSVHSQVEQYLCVIYPVDMSDFTSYGKLAKPVTIIES